MFFNVVLSFNGSVVYVLQKGFFSPLIYPLEARVQDWITKKVKKEKKNNHDKKIMTTQIRFFFVSLCFAFIGRPLEGVIE